MNVCGQFTPAEAPRITCITAERVRGLFAVFDVVPGTTLWVSGMSFFFSPREDKAGPEAQGYCAKNTRLNARGPGFISTSSLNSSVTVGKSLSVTVLCFFVCKMRHLDEKLFRGSYGLTFYDSF